MCEREGRSIDADLKGPSGGTAGGVGESLIGLRHGNFETVPGTPLGLTGTFHPCLARHTHLGAP